MDYGELMLAIDSGDEYKEIQKKSRKKSLWGSIGRAAGGLLALALTPVTAGASLTAAIAGGAALAGGALGSTAAGGGSIKGGKFYKEEREDLQSEVGAFGSENIAGALTAAVTAGMAKKLELIKAGNVPKTEIGTELIDYGESTIGTGLTETSRGVIPKGGIEKLNTAITEDTQNKLSTVFTDSNIRRTGTESVLSGTGDLIPLDVPEFKEPSLWQKTINPHETNRIFGIPLDAPPINEENIGKAGELFNDSTKNLYSTKWSK